MAVTVANGVVNRIRREADNIIIMVRDPSDPAAAIEALAAAAPEISALDGGWRSAPNLEPGDTNGPKYVSEVLPTARGPMIIIDGGYTPPKLLATIPDIIARHVAAAGVEDATIAWPRQGGRLTNLLFGTPIPAQVAQLTLYSPTPPRWRVYVEAPDAWLEEAAAWVEGGPGPRKTVSASVAATELSLAPGATKGFLRQALDMRTNSCRVVSGRIDKAMHVAAVGYFGAGIMPSVSLSAGGATMGEADLGAVFESLVAVARRLAPTVSYAHIAIQPCFSGYPGGSGGCPPAPRHRRVRRGRLPLPGARAGPPGPPGRAPAGIGPAGGGPRRAARRRRRRLDDRTGHAGPEHLLGRQRPPSCPRRVGAGPPAALAAAGAAQHGAGAHGVRAGGHEDARPGQRTVPPMNPPTTRWLFFEGGMKWVSDPVR